MEMLSDRLERIPGSYAIAVGFIIITLFAVIFALTGAPLSFALFFFIPITLVTFSAGASPGSAAAITSAIAWLLADLSKAIGVGQVWVSVFNAVIALAFFLLAVYVLWEYKKILQRERKCSHEDHLTGIPNLRGFFELAEREVIRAKRKITPISVAYLGLDNLSEVIERHGKKTADTILQNLAHSLVGNTRGTDVIARIGETDFILLMSETGIEGGMKGIRRVNDLLMQTIEEYEMALTFSIGLVTYNILPETIEQLIEDANAVKDKPHTPGSDPIQHKVVDL